METEKESESEGKVSQSWADRIALCAAAHPCVELVRSDNRVRWGALFMLLIWLHTEEEAESCLDSIKKKKKSAALFALTCRCREGVFVQKRRLHQDVSLFRRHRRYLPLFFPECLVGSFVQIGLPGV